MATSFSNFCLEQYNVKMHDRNAYYILKVCEISCFQIQAIHHVNNTK